MGTRKGQMAGVGVLSYSPGTINAHLEDRVRFPDTLYVFFFFLYNNFFFSCSTCRPIFEAIALSIKNRLEPSWSAQATWPLGIFRRTNGLVPPNLRERV